MDFQLVPLHFSYPNTGWLPVDEDTVQSYHLRLLQHNFTDYNLEQMQSTILHEAFSTEHDTLELRNWKNQQNFLHSRPTINQIRRKISTAANPTGRSVAVKLFRKEKRARKRGKNNLQLRDINLQQTRKPKNTDEPGNQW